MSLEKGEMHYLFIFWVFIYGTLVLAVNNNPSPAHFSIKKIIGLTTKGWNKVLPIGLDFMS